MNQNIKKAQDEIDRLEEATTQSTASKTSDQLSADVAVKPVENEGANGHISATAEDTVAEVSTELQKISLEAQEQTWYEAIKAQVKSALPFMFLIQFTFFGCLTFDVEEKDRKRWVLSRVYG